MAKELKVIVTVRGGIVQFIHASSELVGVKFEVLDYDNLKEDENGIDINTGVDWVKVAEGEIENKQLVEVY